MNKYEKPIVYFDMDDVLVDLQKDLDELDVDSFLDKL